MDEKKELNQTPNQEPTTNVPEVPPEPVNTDGAQPPLAPIVTPTPPSLTATQPSADSTPAPTVPPPAGTMTKAAKPVQKKLVVMGLIVAGLGLLLWPITSFLVAVLFATAGALVIIVGIFVKP